MLPASAVTPQIIASRRAYWAAVRARDAGILHSTALKAVQREIDVLTCLLDESEDGVHEKINGLIDQFEALRKAMAH